MSIERPWWSEHTTTTAPLGGILEPPPIPETGERDWTLVEVSAQLNSRYGHPLVAVWRRTRLASENPQSKDEVMKDAMKTMEKAIETPEEYKVDKTYD